MLTLLGRLGMRWQFGIVILAIGLLACTSGGGEPVPATTNPPTPVPTPTAAPTDVPVIIPTLPAPTMEVPASGSEVSESPTAVPTPTLMTRPTPTPSPTPITNSVSVAETTPVPDPTAVPTTTPSKPPQVWRVGLLEDITSTNIWEILGVSGTASNYYVFRNRYPSLYKLSDMNSNWVPSLATDKPTDLKRRGDVWSLEVSLKDGVQWSDGEQVTAHDVAFTVSTALELQMFGDWTAYVDRNHVHSAEALDDQTVRFNFKTKPGLAYWEYGLSQMPILAKHYWDSVVSEARSTGSKDTQRSSLFQHVPAEEPTAGEMLFVKWEPGSVVEMKRNPNYYWSGSVVKEYPNGAYVEQKPGAFEFHGYGEPVGEPSLTMARGPNVDSVIFRVYEDQNAAVTALRSDQIDYILGPHGIAPPLHKYLEGRNIGTLKNAANEVHYLGFNMRQSPMDSREFRQAVATLIDKEFITNVVLQGSALPTYSLVPEANEFWWNSNVPAVGSGLPRQDRINRAVDLLKQAGFTWEKEPLWNQQTSKLEQGEGLRLPDGRTVPGLELLCTTADDDRMGATAAGWIESWLNEVGIPVKVGFADPKEIERRLSGLDASMYLLTSKLALFPRHLVEFFHSDYDRYGRQNLGGYENAEFDRLAEQFLTDVHLADARLTAFELQAFIADDLPLVPLFNAPIVEAYRADVVKWAFTEVLDGLQTHFSSINGPMSSTLVG